MTSSDTTSNNNNNTPSSKCALVIGTCGAQSQAVVEGLLTSEKYSTVYAATRDPTSLKAIEVSKMGATLLKVDISSPSQVKNVLMKTDAEYIFLVTTTDMPPKKSKTFKEAEEKEYNAIKSFFDILIRVHDLDDIPRHVIFSTFDNVQSILQDEDDDELIQPLEDGSVVAHFTGKGRGGDYGLAALESIEGLSLTLLTLPFLHSNFHGFAIPLPNEGKTEWTIEAAFGDAAIDMFSTHDLAYIVPSIFNDRELYANYNIRVSAEQLTMEEVSSMFTDLFGKDVIYNPLTVGEMSSLPIAGAPAFAQMCQFLSSPYSKHDVEVTEAIMFPQKPQLFKDWLLTHSDAPEFDEIGLNYESMPILAVTVFAATGAQGRSVVKGLLEDDRKQYTIRATSRDIDNDKALELRDLDPERITLVQCDFDDFDSCFHAVDGVDGVFLVTDFYGAADQNEEIEERHARNVIDACEKSKSVRHLVFSTLESVEEMNRHFDLGLPVSKSDRGIATVVPSFDAKARAAAYARTKKLSCTYVLMPVYSERFFELLAPEVEWDENTGEKQVIIQIPKDEDLQVMCMSVDELGPAVANIFDSYEVYAGREIGLVTDFVTVSEVVEMITEMFFEEEDDNGNETSTTVEKKEVTIDAWVEKQETTAKDLGPMFGYLSKTEAVKQRRSIAQTLQLVPDARPFKEWLEQNRDNISFREKLGLD